MVDAYSLAPDAPLVPVPPDGVQIGDGPDGIRLVGVSRPEIELLGTLRSPTLVEEFTARAGSVEIDAERALVLWEALLGAGLLQVRRPRDRGAVLVSGLDPAGLHIARRLVAAGLPIALSDPRRVTLGDVGGPGGYPPLMCGMRREAAAADVLGEMLGAGGLGSSAANGATSAEAVWPRIERRPSIVVIVRRHALTLSDVATFVHADVPHLPVVLGSSTATVGPLVVPGRSACLRCADLHRCDADPDWPGMVTSLDPSTQSGRPLDDPPAHSALTDLAAGWAVTTVSSWWDGHLPWLVGQSMEVRVPDGAPLVRRWLPHPDCGCSLSAGAAA